MKTNQDGLPTTPHPWHREAAAEITDAVELGMQNTEDTAAIDAARGKGAT